MKYPVFPHKNTPETPLFLGHRGFTPVAPENSLPSFEAAGKRGFWAIETDVRLTRDGVMVCCHNATTAARFDADLTVSECTYAELLKLTMANDDPFDLAMNYGKAQMIIAGLLPQFERIFNIEKKEIDIACDFLAEETMLYARADLRMPLARLIGALVDFIAAEMKK